MKRSRVLCALAVAFAACQRNGGAVHQTSAGQSGLKTSKVPDESNFDPPLCVFLDHSAFYAGPTVIADLADGLSSDGHGPYLKGAGGVIASGVGDEAVLTIGDGDPDSIPRRRTFTVNLSKPVPGGGNLPLGVLTSGNRVGLIVQWRMMGDTIVNLDGIAVGQTVRAAQMNASFHIDNRKHLLQMGPQANGHCAARKNLVHGDGTSSGTIYRASRTKWVMDLPPGSVGRLFDIEDSWDHAIDRGPYYVHLHWEIGN